MHMFYASISRKTYAHLVIIRYYAKHITRASINFLATCYKVWFVHLILRYRKILISDNIMININMFIYLYVCVCVRAPVYVFMQNNV